jgi:hypothetical protein
MEMVADVTCYHCGWISGRIAGEKGTPRAQWVFEGRDGAVAPLSNQRRLRCSRCRGPVFAEDMRSRLLSEPLAPVRVAGAA